MSAFHFFRPSLFLLLIPLLLLFAFKKFKTTKPTYLNQICSPDLLPYIVKFRSKGASFFYPLLFFILSLLVFAVAGPSWQKSASPLMQSQTGAVVALDLSKTMDTADIKPSRLKRALFKLEDFLKKRVEGTTALLVFAEDAFVVTPLTEDTSTIQAMIPALQTSIMPSNGHSPFKAVAKAIDLLQQGGIVNGSILLITAELSKEEGESIAQLTKQNHVQVSVLAVGTEKAAPIEDGSGGFVKDSKGNVLVSRLSKNQLKKLSRATGGVYQTITNTDQDIEILSSHINQASFTAVKSNQNAKENWHDQGYLFILFALPFFLLFFRKGLLIILFFTLPYQLQALAWNDLWQRPDQQAANFYSAGQFDQACEKFADPNWKAASYYQLKNYEAAATLYQGDHSATGYYNYGTAKAKNGELLQALAAYERALEIDPSNEDAKYNKELIEEALKKDKEDKESPSPNQQKNEQDTKEEQKKESSPQNPSSPQSPQENTSSKQAQDFSSDKPASKNPNSKKEKKSASQDSPLQEDQEQTAISSSQEQQNLEEQFCQQMNKELKQESKKDQRPNLQQAPKEDFAPSAKQPGANQSQDFLQELPQEDLDARLLDRIEDDPCTLLRRKFLFQSRQKKQP